MRSISTRQRRDLLTRRHHLGGDAGTPEQVARALIGLHATDPATVFLSTLVRGRAITLAEILDATYGRRTLVRWMAMRRTLFVFPRETVPIVHAAVSRPLAVTLRKRLERQLELNGSQPAIDGDIGAWLSSVEDAVQRALLARGTATGLQLSADEPRLRTFIPPRAPSDFPQNVTSPLLTVMSTEGKLVRGTATGPWTARQHRWEAPDRWWPDGLPDVSAALARRALARAWLVAFGPAPISDLEWWTGWSKTVVQSALSGLPITEVDLDGERAFLLDDPAVIAELDLPAPDPTVTLLPALDPTSMGWKRREWFLAVDPAPLFDRNGNIGPTLWWNGEVIGGWAVAPTGEIRIAVLADRGTEVLARAERAAAELQARIEGAVVTPTCRTPLERSLSEGLAG
ncbi:MAG: winged helix DNA-binding domain-containing protein [Myxococcota bacterium]